jgi:hypothetical protein
MNPRFLDFELWVPFILTWELADNGIWQEMVKSGLPSISIRF